MSEMLISDTMAQFYIDWLINIDLKRHTDSSEIILLWLVERILLRPHILLPPYSHPFSGFIQSWASESVVFTSCINIQFNLFGTWGITNFISSEASQVILHHNSKTVYSGLRWQMNKIGNMQTNLSCRLSASTVYRLSLFKSERGTQNCNLDIKGTVGGQLNHRAVIILHVSVQHMSLLYSLK